MIQEQLDYISKGKIGCTFAALAACSPDRYDWGFYVILSKDDVMPQTVHSTVSLIFPKEWKQEDVRAWALSRGFYEQDIKAGTWWRRFKRWLKKEKLIGLRRECNGHEAYVMYFGQDSHCPTRQTPYPMLTFRAKRSYDYFYRVGWKGVLHIAQMPVFVALYKAEALWKSSFANTKRIIGKKPDENHAAKTTFKL